MYNETNVKESVYGLTNIPNVEMSRRRHQMTIMGVRCILMIKKLLLQSLYRYIYALVIENSFSQKCVVFGSYVFLHFSLVSMLLCKCHI